MGYGREAQNQQRASNPGPPEGQRLLQIGYRQEIKPAGFRQLAGNIPISVTVAVSLDNPHNPGSRRQMPGNPAQIPAQAVQPDLRPGTPEKFQSVFTPWEGQGRETLSRVSALRR